jgi:O-6-methylguanine DNA methyltransferase
VATTDTGVLAIARGDDPDLLLREVERRRRGAAVTLDLGPVAIVLAQLAAYFDGTLRDFNLQLDFRGAPAFDVAAWDAARGIPYGATASYGDLATAVGSPRGARAVGGAMHRCPVAPVVPCHRVIHADGSIRGWGTDLWVKRWLLNHERR